MKSLQLHVFNDKGLKVFLKGAQRPITDSVLYIWDVEQKEDGIGVFGAKPKGESVPTWHVRIDEIAAVKVVS